MRRFFLIAILSGVMAVPVMAAGKEEKEFKKRLGDFSEICLKERVRLNKKNKATKEDPAASCKCMEKALESKHELEPVEALIEEYQTADDDNTDPQRPEPLIAFIAKIEENCIADSNWKMGTYEPDHIEEKLDELLKPAKKTSAPKSP